MIGSLTVEDLVASPGWYPLERAPGENVLCIRLDEDDYRAASFLDQRAVAFAHGQAACDIALLESTAAGLPRRAHHLLHIGHVGSTLISRLLGEHAALFCVREPALLRTLALEPGARGVPSLDALLAVLARTWRPEQRALIKESSFVNEIAGELLKRSGGSAAIFMHAAPLAYLQSILGGPNSRIESRTLGAHRLRRLRRLAEPARWDPAFDPRSEGEWIAMSWLCEIASLDRAAGAAGRSPLWLDFDRFLADPAAALEALFRTLGEPITTDAAERLARSPIMDRYSKAPEYPYDAALRREVLAAAAAEHRDEIARGLAWLERMAARLPLARVALEARQAEWAA